MSSCAKETCIHSSVCMYYADRCTTNGDCSDFKSPQPKRPHGEWISQDEFSAYYKCSNCGIMIDNDFPIWRNFCPNCGARMKEGESE